MKEILTCDVWTGLKIKAVIDRETGEFVLFNFRFRLHIQDNKASLMECDGGVLIFTGYWSENIWCFEGTDFVREAQDPFIAVIQILYDVLQY